VCFEAQNLRTRRYPAVEVSLAVRRGEILGLAGLVGAGRSELAQAIFGVEQPLAGRFRLDDKPVSIQSPRDAIRRGIYLVPEDRRTRGLIAQMSVRENVTLPALSRYAFAGWVKNKTERAAARQVCVDLGIKT